MFQHNCGREIFLRRTIVITTGLSISSASIKPTGKSAILGETSSYELYCEKCGPLKVAKDISMRCFECGKEFNATDLYTISGAGGVYCKQDAEENFVGMRKYNIGATIDKAISSKGNE